MLMSPASFTASTGTVTSVSARDTAPFMATASVGTVMSVVASVTAPLIAIASVGAVMSPGPSVTCPGVPSSLAPVSGVGVVGAGSAGVVPPPPNSPLMESTNVP